LACFACVAATFLFQSGAFFRDTHFSMKKPVSLHGTGPFAPIPSSDTDFCSENGVSQSGANFACGAKLPDAQLIRMLWVGENIPPMDA